MSPKKLTEADKQEILQLYRLPDETTSTLADRYSVSSSTISRFLKSTLQGDEYEELIQQKRLNRTNKSSNSESSTPTLPLKVQGLPPKLKLEVSKPLIEPSLTSTSDTYEVEEEDEEAEFIALEEMWGEDIAEEDDDEDDDDWDEPSGEEDDDGCHLQAATSGINILPLEEAPVPRICYLVVDRAAELITRPLKEFGDLGQIPATEVQQRTLPVFDNHRVAKRFSNRFQRVIKVPDGRMLQKTGSYLEAKGITRLLIDGKVYCLSSPEDN